MFSKIFESFEGSMFANALTLNAIGQSVRENPYYTHSGRTEAEVLNNVTQKLIDKANLAEKNGDYEGAVVLSELAIEFSPTLPFCYMILGEAHALLWNYEKAIENLNKGWSLIEQDPRYSSLVTEDYREAHDKLIKMCQKRIKGNAQIKRLITRIKVHNQGMLLTAVLNGIIAGLIEVPEEARKVITDTSSMMGQEYEDSGGMYVPLFVEGNTHNFTLCGGLNKDGSYRCGAQFVSPRTTKEQDEYRAHFCVPGDSLAIDIFPQLQNYITKFPVLKDLKVRGGILTDDGKPDITNGCETQWSELTTDKPKAKGRARKTKQ